MALRVPQAEYGGVGFRSPRRLRIQAAYLPRWLPVFSDSLAVWLRTNAPWPSRDLLCNLHAPSPVLRSPVIWHFIQAGNVPKLPSAVLASSLVIVGVLSFVVGLLNRVTEDAPRSHALGLPALLLSTPELISESTAFMNVFQKAWKRLLEAGSFYRYLLVRVLEPRWTSLFRSSRCSRWL